MADRIRVTLLIGPLYRAETGSSLSAATGGFPPSVFSTGGREPISVGCSGPTHRITTGVAFGRKPWLTPDGLRENEAALFQGPDRPEHGAIIGGLLECIAEHVRDTTRDRGWLPVAGDVHALLARGPPP